MSVFQMQTIDDASAKDGMSIAALDSRKKTKVFKLYRVVLSPRKGKPRTYHVLAASKSGAACQAKCADRRANVMEGEDAPKLHVHVKRVPVLIRGWGDRTF